MQVNMKLLTILLIAVGLSLACGGNTTTPSSGGGSGQTVNATNANIRNSKVNQVAENKPTENKVTPPVNVSKPADEMPKFAKGEAYKSVREKLIKAGWTPFKSKDADECRGDDVRCKDFPEMEACAGTGLGNCRYLWKKNNKTLAIFTIGETPSYSDQEFVKS
jgi:hypothetical protein